MNQLEIINVYIQLNTISQYVNMYVPGWYVMYNMLIKTKTKLELYKIYKLKYPISKDLDDIQTETSSQKSSSNEKSCRPELFAALLGDDVTPSFWYSATLFSKKLVLPSSERFSMKSKGLLTFHTCERRACHCCHTIIHQIIVNDIYWNVMSNKQNYKNGERIYLQY